MNCRLCFKSKLKKVTGADDRAFYLCLDCQVISASPEHFLSGSEEIERYLSHNNGTEHQGYIDFLNRAVKPALRFLTKDMLGMDYGCGYAPTLSLVLTRQGYRCENYDPYFIKNDLEKKYDFIFSTEVFEHFCYPRRDIEKIAKLLQPNGILIVMTERWTDLEKFRYWYYTRDPSHVVFYHDTTFEYICSEFGFQKIYDDERRVLLLRKIQGVK